MQANITQPGAFFSTGDPTTSIESTPYAPGMLGSSVTVKSDRATPGATAGRVRTWQYVQGDSGMATAPFLGAVMWWFDKTKYQVTTDPTVLGRGNVAGIAQTPAGTAFPAGSFFWIQRQGPGTVKLINGETATPTATNALQIIPSATAGKADAMAAGTAATYPVLGVSAAAKSLADNTVVVNLDVPETV